MGYINKNLIPDESVIYRAQLHWIIFAKAAPSFLLAIIFFIISSNTENYSFLLGIGFIFLLAAIFAAIGSWMKLKTSEFAVTNKRVLIKVGFIRRHSLELPLQKVEGIGVDQGLLGRLLGFGTIIVTGTGGTKERFDGIALPLEFRKQVQAQVAV